MIGFLRHTEPHSQQVPLSGSGPSMQATMTSHQSIPCTSVAKMERAVASRCALLRQPDLVPGSTNCDVCRLPLFGIGR